MGQGHNHQNKTQRQPSRWDTETTTTMGHWDNHQRPQWWDRKPTTAMGHRNNHRDGTSKQPPWGDMEATIIMGHRDNHHNGTWRWPTWLEIETYPVHGSEQRSRGVPESGDSGAAESCRSLRTAWDGHCRSVPAVAPWCQRWHHQHSGTMTFWLHCRCCVSAI